MGCFVPAQFLEKHLKRTFINELNMCDRLMQAYLFDFNSQSKGGPTFEEKVMKSNTNDLGMCSYSPQLAHIMITEFKKFMVCVE